MSAVPVAFFIYNRPLPTKIAFDAIAAVRPRRLIVVADGPKTPDDAIKCELARQATAKVDWPCDVMRLYSDTNLGCRDRFVSGLASIFDFHERAILIEDDCVPHISFFPFAEELLERYQHERRVTTISGNCFAEPRSHTSYVFTRYVFQWGWATWRRAWLQYDSTMRLWPTLRPTNWPHQVIRSRAGAAWLRAEFDSVAKGITNTWDTQWLYSSWLHDGYAIVPDRNLVTNIGAGPDATHTKAESPRIGLRTDPMRFPLHHPTSLSIDHAFEEQLLRSSFGFSYWRLARRAIGARLPQPVVDGIREWFRSAPRQVLSREPLGRRQN